MNIKNQQLAALRHDLEVFNWSGDISLSGTQWRNWEARKHRMHQRAKALGTEGTREWDLAVARWHEVLCANR